MRLVRYGRPGKEKPGLFDEEGRLRDLSGIIDDIDPSQLSDKALRKLAKLDQKTLPLVRGNPRLGVPVKGIGKFIGVGMNYLDLYLELNGKRMQTGNTASMIFSVAQLVSYVSRFMTLEPGDIITTGTPPGVGMGRKPQRFLKKGDQLRLGIAGLGEQQADVVAYPK
jgi:hypothetical protein